METSNVPPPKSNTNINFSPFSFSFAFLSFLFFPSNPKAKAAASGSFKVPNTLNPAFLQASIVAFFCSSLKCAGIVTTQLSTLVFKCLSALLFNFANESYDHRSDDNAMVSNCPFAINLGACALEKYVEINPLEISPMEALNKLYELKKEMNKKD